MIDLHTHTTESDGTYSPAELVEAALAEKLDALAITDHDTFAGYDRASPLARARGLDLVCGIELNTRMHFARGGSKTVHLLVYFLGELPSLKFRSWIDELQAGRRDRNARLVQRLQSMNIEIQLSEVEALGRSLAGRPHFARILVQKGYARSTEEAFRDLIGENAPGFIERESPHLPMAAHRAIACGGFPVIAHPIRLGLRNWEEEEACIAEMRDSGVRGIEAYHSDQSPGDSARYLALAAKYDLTVTGGSDFHGANKPRISLGTGLNGNIAVPSSLLVNLRKRAPLPQ